MMYGCGHCRLAPQVDWLGPKVGGHPALFCIHQSNRVHLAVALHHKHGRVHYYTGSQKFHSFYCCNNSVYRLPVSMILAHVRRHRKFAPVIVGPSNCTTIYKQLAARNVKIVDQSI